MMYLEEHSVENTVRRIAKPEICKTDFKIFSCDFPAFQLNAWVATEELLYLLAVVYSWSVINIK